MACWRGGRPGLELRAPGPAASSLALALSGASIPHLQNGARSLPCLSSNKDINGTWKMYLEGSSSLGALPVPAPAEPLIGAWPVTIAANSYCACIVYQTLFSVLLYMLVHLLFATPRGRRCSNDLPFSNETAEAQRS